MTVATDVNAPCIGCFICGDPDDHDGMAHSDARGDGLTRRDVAGPAIPLPDWDGEFERYLGGLI